MIEAFGTNKQKRALSSRRLNQVGSETLHQAVAKAANAVIDEKGLEGEPHSHRVRKSVVRIVVNYLFTIVLKSKGK